MVAAEDELLANFGGAAAVLLLLGGEPADHMGHVTPESSTMSIKTEDCIDVILPAVRSLHRDCSKCGRNFTHPPALAIHQKACDGVPYDPLLHGQRKRPTYKKTAPRPAVDTTGEVTKRNGQHGYKAECETCGRVFTHPPAFTVHRKACGGVQGTRPQTQRPGFAGLYQKTLV